MSNEIIRYSEETFESIKHINEYGYEFWYARELQSVLEYTEWRNFQKLIKKAQTACENSDMAVEECFVEVNKTIRYSSSMSFLRSFFSAHMLMRCICSTAIERMPPFWWNGGTR